MDSTAIDLADPRVGDILRIVAKETEQDMAKLRPEATIEELGIPSLDMAQTLFALEDHFDVEIPVISERAGAEFATVADLVAHVLAAVDKKQVAPQPSAA
jgi:acyl carrier protein